MSDTSFQRLFRMRCKVLGAPDRMRDVAMSMYIAVQSEIDTGARLDEVAAIAGYRASDSAGVDCDAFVDRFACTLASA